MQVLVRSMNTRNDFSVNYLISWYELQVPELRTLAIQRNRAVVEGIRKRLPQVLLRQLSCSCTRSSLARRCSGPSIRMVS